MANLAIRGHANRGKEVIEILEMLGGKNIHNYNGTFNECYVIDNDKICTIYTCVAKIDGFVIITLEEFLEKFPYKVGDKVLAFNEQCSIANAFWDKERNEVLYLIHIIQGGYVRDVSSCEIQPYKEETMGKASKAVFDANAQCCDIMNHLIKEETMEETIKIDIPKGYEFAGFDDDNQQVVFEKIGYQYPKTYYECCEVLDWNHRDYDRVGYKSELLCKLQVLLLCRDAYWKLAGEQMGLEKPWEPDWDDENEFKYGLYHFRNGIMYDGSCINPTLLAFPTAEMRDAFYENFKDLINETKELL